MQITCLNENDPQVKKDIRKYGRERVYAAFIENGFIYPDDIRSMILQDIDGFLNHRVEFSANNKYTHPPFTLKYGVGENDVVPSDERDEIVRAVSGMSVISGDVEQTLSDLHSEYVVSSQDIHRLGELKGYTEDEILIDTEALEEEILSNKGYPILAEVLELPEQADALKRGVELFNTQFESPLENYIATAGDIRPEIVEVSRNVNIEGVNRRITVPTSTPIRTNNVYKIIKKVSDEEGDNDGKFIRLYDEMIEDNDASRVFNQFLIDVFGENVNEAVDSLNDNNFPVGLVENLSGNQKILFDQLYNSLYNGNEWLQNQIDQVNNQEQILEEFGLTDSVPVATTSNTNVSDNDILDSHQEVC